MSKILFHGTKTDNLAVPPENLTDDLDSYDLYRVIGSVGVETLKTYVIALVFKNLLGTVSFLHPDEVFGEGIVGEGSDGTVRIGQKPKEGYGARKLINIPLYVILGKNTSEIPDWCQSTPWK